MWGNLYYVMTSWYIEVVCILQRIHIPNFTKTIFQNMVKNIITMYESGVGNLPMWHG